MLFDDLAFSRRKLEIGRSSYILFLRWGKYYTVYWLSKSKASEIRVSRHQSAEWFTHHMIWQVKCFGIAFHSHSIVGCHTLLYGQQHQVFLNYWVLWTRKIRGSSISSCTPCAVAICQLPISSTSAAPLPDDAKSFMGFWNNFGGYIKCILRDIGM